MKYEIFSNRGPAVGRCGIFQRDIVAGTGAGDGAQTGRKPHKHLAKTQAAERKRLAHGDAVENVEIGALDSNRKEGKGPGLFAGANKFSRAPPIVGRFAVTDQKDPGAIV